MKHLLIGSCLVILLVLTACTSENNNAASDSSDKSLNLNKKISASTDLNDETKNSQDSNKETTEREEPTQNEEDTRTTETKKTDQADKEQYQDVIKINMTAIESRVVEPLPGMVAVAIQRNQLSNAHSDSNVKIETTQGIVHLTYNNEEDRFQNYDIKQIEVETIKQGTIVIE